MCICLFYSIMLWPNKTFEPACHVFKNLYTIKQLQWLWNIFRKSQFVCNCFNLLLQCESASQDLSRRSQGLSSLCDFIAATPIFHRYESSLRQSSPMITLQYVYAKSNLSKLQSATSTICICKIKPFWVTTITAGDLHTFYL